MAEQEVLPSEYFDTNLLLVIIFKRLNIIAIGKIIEHKYEKLDFKFDFKVLIANLYNPISIPVLLII